MCDGRNVSLGLYPFDPLTQMHVLETPTSYPFIVRYEAEKTVKKIALLRRARFSYHKIREMLSMQSTPKTNKPSTQPSS